MKFYVNEGKLKDVINKSPRSTLNHAKDEGMTSALSKFGWSWKYDRRRDCERVQVTVSGTAKGVKFDVKAKGS